MASQDNKPKSKNEELRMEAERLARLLYRIYKEDYPKIKHRMKHKS